MMCPINSNMKVKSLMAAHSRLPAAAFKIRGSGLATKYLLIAAGEALPTQDVAFIAALSTSVCVLHIGELVHLWIQQQLPSRGSEA